MHAEHRCGLLVEISHVARSVFVCLCLGTRASCAKTVEPIKMPSG